MPKAHDLDLAGAGQQAQQVEQTAKQAATSPAARLLARAGYVAKGVVYILVGGLAAKLAVGTSGTTPDRQSAIHAIYAQPFGKALLLIVALGLLGYALWCAAQALLGLGEKASGAKGVVERISYGAIALSYIGLALGAAQLALGSGSGGTSSGTTTRDWTARLLSAPGGVALVVIVGLVVLGIAGVLYYQAYGADFRKHFALGGLRPEVQRGIVALGRAGNAALGVVFTIIGALLIAAAVQRNPGEATGIGGALVALTQHPLGHVLLAIVALGLLAYGLFSLAEARYRRIGRS